MATKHIYKLTVDSKKRLATKREDIPFMEILTYLANAQALLLAEIKKYGGEEAYQQHLESLRNYIGSEKFEEDVVDKMKYYENVEVGEADSDEEV